MALWGTTEKPVLWGGINFEWGAMRMVLGPRMDWVPESFSSTTTSVLPGESIVYGQAQFFLGPLDMGILAPGIRIVPKDGGRVIGFIRMSWFIPKAVIPLRHGFPGSMMPPARSK